VPSAAHTRSTGGGSGLSQITSVLTWKMNVVAPGNEGNGFDATSVEQNQKTKSARVQIVSNRLADLLSRPADYIIYIVRCLLQAFDYIEVR
jgi:hypothetical protein